MEFDLADKRHLEGAEGWLELGNWREAHEELEQSLMPVMQPRCGRGMVGAIPKVGAGRQPGLIDGISLGYETGAKVEAGSWESGVGIF
jgi:hypothetical protein